MARLTTLAAAALAALIPLADTVAATGTATGTGTGTGTGTTTPAPDWLHVVRRDRYDGVGDDLVTGGLGVAGLSGDAPAYGDPAAPTFAELRRAVLRRPPTAANGFGRLFGPAVDHRTGQPAGDGRIAGDEVLAYADDGSGRVMAGLLLQVPAGFDPARACIVAVATPGSQNVWADMQRGGYWGLARGCAVVWADKGLGAGVYEVDSRRGVGIDGQLVGQAARLMPAESPALQAFAASHPHRLGYKWAHGGWTQEADWGQSVLRAVQFALFELGSRTWPGGATVTRGNTKVIASGFSNGGGAVLKAAEQDDQGLIDGVVAMSPQIMTPMSDKVVVEQGARRRVGGNRTIFDTLSFSNLYKSCAALALPDTPGASGLKFAANRCASLADAGLLKAGTVQQQARESLDRLHAFGLQPEADGQIAGGALAEQSALGQASQYGRFTMEESLCGLGFATVDQAGRPRAATAAESAQWFASQVGGTPDGRIVTTINEADPDGARQSSMSVSRSTGRQDYNFDAALCLRELAVGSSANALRVQAGLRSVLATGDLRSHPTLIVHGRADPVEPPDFTSRAYLGLHSLVAARPDTLRYVEVTRATHGEPGPAATGLVPLSPYQLQALEAMWAHLLQGKPLPPSQLVRTSAPSGSAGGKPRVEAVDLPSIAASPRRADRIFARDGRVRVPD